MDSPQNTKVIHLPPPWIRPQPPPPASPALLPTQTHKEDSLLVTGMTIMGSMLCSALILYNPILHINTIGLQQSVIDSIAVFKYKKDGGLIEGTECSVCLNEFREDERLRLLPKCSHGFHLPCLSNETLVENDIREDGTNEELRICRNEDGNTRKILGKMGHSDRNVLSEATAEHEHCGSLDTEVEELKYWKGKIGANEAVEVQAYAS
ncbi:hypothetical protein F3Y22_tig00110461pilonHSYRG00032 [Hibiscus syriacus]|uniref:RING-type E3 ubiquitin transferase n=1 Tax=Hibiscus syriacus TaxID=106335 RepID=A0A6A3AJN7_HIBSY|nr:hypothetical protein F3Y22_tig00110461pilonHSYRG00032 [Hibiscus syriacus]